MPQWENNPNCFSAIWRSGGLRTMQAEPFFPPSCDKKRAVLKLIMPLMWCRWGAQFPTEAIRSEKCTLGKMLLIKALGERRSLACSSGVVGWWCTASWPNGCSVDKQCSKQSLYASFSYLLPFKYTVYSFRLWIIWSFGKYSTLMLCKSIQI